MGAAVAKNADDDHVSLTLETTTKTLPACVSFPSPIPPFFYKNFCSHCHEHGSDPADVSEAVADGEDVEVEGVLVVLRDGGQPEDHDGHHQVQQVERRQACKTVEWVGGNIMARITKKLTQNQSSELMFHQPTFYGLQGNPSRRCRNGRN